ncbi:MAG: hypothetical protein KME16_09780 [Scytolyngbya sp. HA4215-MV1]|jgi:hypothetical protein|nr:hypothetical protein [Scytolyngbya sp. HA4215-MV1]
MLLDTFIPTELAIAPNALGLTCNLKLKTIPIDAQLAFELWSPEAAGKLLPEEAMLLQRDLPRLEEICAKLVWLLGATYMDEEGACAGESISSWQSVTQMLQARGYRVDAIEVTHLPQTICLLDRSEHRTSGWLVQPVRWKFSFLELHPVQRRFEAVAHPISLLVSFGKPLIKSEGAAA